MLLPPSGCGSLGAAMLPGPPHPPQAAGLTTHLDCCHGPALGGSLPGAFGAFQAFFQGLFISPLCLTPRPGVHCNLIPPHPHGLSRAYSAGPRPRAPLHCIPPIFQGYTSARGWTEQGSGMGRPRLKTHPSLLYWLRDSCRCHLTSLSLNCTHTQNGSNKASQEQTK